MNELNVLHPPSLMALAQTGDFRAIAYWLNSSLVPQGILVRVGQAGPGCLHVLAEFSRPPAQDRLLRFICYRLCRLNSAVIQSVHVTARIMGQADVLWEQGARLRQPSRLQRQPQARPLRRPLRQRTRYQSRQQPRLQARTQARRQALQALRHRSQPKLQWQMPPLRRQLELIGTQMASHQVASQEWATQQWANLSQAMTDRLQNPPSPWLSGTAIAAFVIGCGVEVLSQHPLLTPEGNPQTITAAQPSVSQDEFIQTAAGRVPVTRYGAVGGDPASVTLSFSADVDLGRPATVANLEAAATDVDYAAADVALINMAQPSGPGAMANLSPSAAAAEAITSAEIVSLASNRVMADGPTGLIETLNELEQAGMRPLGAGRNRQEARRPEILEVKGQRIAYLGYSDQDTYAAGTLRPGTNPAIKEDVAEDIQAIRSQVDWVIVNYHWNQDLADYPGDRQVDLAHFAIDQGADLVVGHHPNVLQGAEIYKGRAIAYSLGNFIFAPPGDGAEQEETPVDYDTAVLHVALGDEQMRLEFLPVQVRQSQPTVAQAEKASQILNYIKQASGLFEQPLQSPTILERRAAEADPVEPSAPDLPAAAPTPTEADPAKSLDGFTSFPEAPSLGPAEDTLNESLEKAPDSLEAPKALETEPEFEPEADGAYPFNTTPLAAPSPAEVPQVGAEIEQ